MKTCRQCHNQLTYCSFNRNNKNKDGLQDLCRECGKTRFKQYYSLNKQRIIERTRQNSIKQYSIINEYLRSVKTCCSVCREDSHVCLDFHHVKEKSFNIGEAAHKGYTLDKVKAEIEKCVVLCSNCHRKLHAGLFSLVQEGTDPVRLGVNGGLA
jgi:hypothetical protein